MRDPSVTANAYVNQWDYSTQNAEKLVESLGGKGKIVAMLPIAGSSAAVVQLAALQEVLKDNPEIELLSAEYGDWDRAKAKQLTENLLQRFPQIDGVFSPAGQMSLGVYEAFDEAGAARRADLLAGRRLQRLDQARRQGAEVGRGDERPGGRARGGASRRSPS